MLVGSIALPFAAAAFAVIAPALPLASSPSARLGLRSGWEGVSLGVCRVDLLLFGLFLPVPVPSWGGIELAVVELSDNARPTLMG